MNAPFTFDVLANGDVVFRLGEGCIQTRARRARQEIVDALLAGDANGVAIEPVIEQEPPLEKVLGPKAEAYSEEDRRVLEQRLSDLGYLE